MLSPLTKLSKLNVISTFRSSLIPKTKSRFFLSVMNFSTQALNVEHEPVKNRFIINHEGFESVILYKLKGKTTIHFLHTEVPEEMGGRGVGKVLTKEALQFAKDKNLKVEVSCTFVKHYIDKYEPQIKYVSNL